MYMLYSSYRESSLMWIAWALLLAATLQKLYTGKSGVSFSSRDNKEKEDSKVESE